MLGVEPFELTVPCELSQLKGARHALDTWLESAQMSEDMRATVVLATHEALANAIEHAGPLPAVTIYAAIDWRGLAVEVWDRGRWTAPARTDDERGRGLALIEALVPELDIRSDWRGTRIRMLYPA